MLKVFSLTNDNIEGTDELTVTEDDLEKYIVLETKDWSAIYEFLKAKDRTGSISRNTNETKIQIVLNLDGTGKSDISTGISFFDHMLDQIARHGSIGFSC